MSFSTFVHLGRIPESFLVCLIVLVLALFGTRAQASSAGEWRYWQAQQGLADSFVATISRDLTGALWVVHGEPDPDVITHFDGRDFTFVKAPSVLKQFDSVDGKNGWSVDPHGLHRYLNGKWTSFGDLNISVPYYQHRTRGGRHWQPARGAIVSRQTGPDRGNGGFVVATPGARRDPGRPVQDWPFYHVREGPGRRRLDRR